MNNLVAIDHINLSVKNFLETAQWYKEIFGFEIVEQGLYRKRPWGVLRSQDTMLCIYEDGDRRSASSEDSIQDQFHRINHFGLRIKDKEQWEQTLSKFQLKTYYGSPIQHRFSTSWYVQDPSGHEIEISCWDNNEVRFGIK